MRRRKPYSVSISEGSCPWMHHKKRPEAEVVCLVIKKENRMQMKKSPGGSIFPYPYKGGELFGLHYGSFHADEDALLARMQAEEQFMVEARCHLPVWFDLYETELSDRVLAALVATIDRLKGNMTRLALVGCSARDRRRFLQTMKKLGNGFTGPLRFFSDPEVAKSWLIGESGRN